MKLIFANWPITSEIGKICSHESFSNETIQVYYTRCYNGIVKRIFRSSLQLILLRLSPPFTVIYFIFQLLYFSHIRVNIYYLTLPDLPLRNNKNSAECNKSKNNKISFLIGRPNLVFCLQDKASTLLRR